MRDKKEMPTGRKLYNVNVVVSAARKLYPVDDDGTADPFVTVQLVHGDEPSRKPQRGTTRIKDSLNPVFSDEFCFKELPDNNWGVIVRIMDWNRWRLPKSLGEALVKWSQFDGEFAWRSLHHQKREDDWAGIDLGQVQCKVSLVEVMLPAPPPRRHLSLLKFGFSKKSLDTTRGTRDASDDNVSSAASSTDDEWAGWLYESKPAKEMTQQQPNVLKLAIGEVAMTKAKHYRKLVARAEYRGMERKTGVTSVFQWNETLEIPLPRDTGVSSALVVEVREAPFMFRMQPKKLGTGRIELPNPPTFKRSKGLENVTLRKRRKSSFGTKTTGSITVGWRLDYEPSFDESDNAQWFKSIDDAPNVKDADEPDEVHVVIARARGLKASDIAFLNKPTSDPFAKVRLIRRRKRLRRLSPMVSTSSSVHHHGEDGEDDGSSDDESNFGGDYLDDDDEWENEDLDYDDVLAYAQTHVIKTNLNPIWNAKFVFSLDHRKTMSSIGDDDDDDDDDESFPSEETEFAILVEVYDKDRLTADDFLGRTTIPLAGTIGEERCRQSKTEWHPLKGEDAAGEIQVATRIRRKKTTTEVPSRTDDLATWMPFSPADDDMTKVPNELRVGLVQVQGIVSSVVVFAVVDKNGSTIQEWQSSDRIWRETSAWPVKPDHRDDDFALVARVLPSEATAKLRLSDVVENRPAVETYNLDLGDSASVTLVVQWRHNTALGSRRIRGKDVFFEYGIDDEEDFEAKDQVTPVIDEDDLEEEEEEKKEEAPGRPSPGGQRPPLLRGRPATMKVKSLAFDPADIHAAIQAASPQMPTSRPPPPPLTAQRKSRPTLPSIVRRVKASAGNMQALRPFQDIALPSYAAFVPAVVLREIAERRGKNGEYTRTGSAIQFEKRCEAAVLFADISGFTKLTEKLSARLNGAELLCAELDVVYGQLCEEADALGGDAVKFAGDAICFVWIVGDDAAGGLDLRTATRRAALCARRAHLAIKAHPAVQGVKLTLHAGLSCGDMTCLSLTRQRPTGQRQRAEFVVAGKPLDDIGIAEPLAGPGETVCSPAAWTHLKDAFDKAEPRKKLLKTGEEGYVKLIDRRPLTTEIVKAPARPLMATTLEMMREKDIVHMSPFVPRAFDRILRNKHATATFVDRAKHAKAEIRVLTVAFFKFDGVDVANDGDKARKMVHWVDWAVSHFDGSINKFIVDDKGTLALVVFGLPGSVHDNAPTRCLATVRLIQEKLPSIGVHCVVGITTSRTFCGAVGSQRRMEYTVMGDSVNLSARLMAASAQIVASKEGGSQNGVLVCAATKDATQDEIYYLPHEPVMVKGKSKPVDIFEPKEWKKTAVSGIVATRRNTAVASMPALVDLPRFESHRNKINEVDALFNDVFSTSSENSNNGSRTTCVVLQARNGTYAAMDLVEHVPGLCENRGVHLLRSLPSLSIYHDGLVRATTIAGAWRGPVAAALDVLDDGQVRSFGAGLKDRSLSVFSSEREDAVALADVFLDTELPEGSSREEKRGHRVTGVVLRLIRQAAMKAPVCVVLDNLAQMDSRAWAIADSLASKSSPSQHHPILFCLLNPRTPDEGLRCAEWSHIDNSPTTRKVEVMPLEREESLILAAEVLGICDVTDDDNIRKLAGDKIASQSNLADFVISSGGIRDVLCDMLLEAQRDGAIAVTEGSIQIIDSDLTARPPPPVHANMVLAAVDDSLSPSEHLIIRAASIFKDGFTSTLLHNLAPINVEANYVRDICLALCQELDSGRCILRKRIRGDSNFPNLAAAGPRDDVVFSFVEPLLQKAIADTLLDAQIMHVLQKMDMLPIVGLSEKNWKSALVHPFLLRKILSIREASIRLGHSSPLS